MVTLDAGGKIPFLISSPRKKRLFHFLHFLRYVGGHSHAHFTETGHCYTMELSSNRVWDYVGDNFVHRLVQTDSADGKLVEAEGQGGLDGAVNGDNCKAGAVDGVLVNPDEKLDSIQLEYTYLLTSQLEAQRR